MMRLGVSLAIILLLAGCKEPQVLNSYCTTVREIGYERLLTKFTGDELRALKLDRKRALLAMRKTYEAHCTNKAD
jgi:hypothetical protein